MTDLWTVLLLSLVALAGFWLLGRLVNRVTILEYQGGVRYARGRFSRVLGPGVYWLFRPFSRVEVVDLRRTLLQVAGQEILTKDQATVKVSLVADYEIAEPRQALHGTANYVEALHVSLQLHLRQVVHGLTLDELLAGRGVVDAAVSGLVTPQAAEMGLLLHSVTIKDLMLPTDLKRVYAEVLRAQKEGQATLERARGETAALRSLANAARLLEEQPMLLQLRWMQVVNGSSGNTVVVGSTDPATAGKQAKKQKD